MISIVAPTYFEEECIGELLNRVSTVMDAFGEEYEVVIVDDGSQDRTVSLVLEEIGRRPQVRLVELAYNQGKAAALTAGAAYARGDLVLFMDPDLQDPPESIPSLVAKVREGFDLVLTVREAKADGMLNRVASGVFWWFLRRFTGLPMPEGLGTMRIASRVFVDRFLQYRETNRFIEGLFLHAGLRRAIVRIPHHERFAGRTKFDFKRKLALAIDATVSFSDAPLKAAIHWGMALTVMALLLAVGIIITRTLFFNFQLGWPSLITAILLGFGLNLLFLGILGVYVGKIYGEVKQRPLFAIRQVHGLDRPA